MTPCPYSPMSIPNIRRTSWARFGSAWILPLRTLSQRGTWLVTMPPSFAFLRFVIQCARALNNLCALSLFERIMSASIGKNAAYEAGARSTFCALRPIWMPSCVMPSGSWRVYAVSREPVDALPPRNADTPMSCRVSTRRCRPLASMNRMAALCCRCSPSAQACGWDDSRIYAYA